MSMVHLALSTSVCPDPMQGLRRHMGRALSGASQGRLCSMRFKFVMQELSKSKLFSLSRKMYPKGLMSMLSRACQPQA